MLSSVFFLHRENENPTRSKNGNCAREKKSAREKTLKTLKKSTWKNKVATFFFNKMQGCTYTLTFYPFYQCFFSPWKKKRAREKTWKNVKKCTWKHKSAREIFHQILPVKLKFMHVKKNRKLCPWNYKSAREKIQIFFFSVCWKNMFFSKFFR